MEKFFTINKDSDFYKAYVQYQKDVKANAQAFKKFSEEHGIESTQYIPDDRAVIIIPTENDLQKFQGMFTKINYITKTVLDVSRANCQITKDWLEIAKTVPKPKKPNYFCYGMRFCGKYSTRCL